MRRLVALLACGTLVSAGLLAAASGCESFDASATAAPDGGGGDESTATPDAGAATDGSLDADAGPSLHAVHARAFGSTNGGGDAGASVFPGSMVVDPGGGVAIVGSYGFGAVDLGPGTSLPVPSGADAFLARFNANGEHVSSRAFTNTQDQYGGALAASTTTLYAAFELQGTMLFDGADGVQSTATGARFNSGLVRLDGAFHSSGIATFRSTANALVKSAAVGAGGSAIAFGDWDDNLSVNGGSSATRGATKPGLFVMRSFGITGTDVIVNDLCTDGTTCIAGAIATTPGSGGALAGGRYTGQLKGPDGGITTAPNDNDGYLVKLDPNLVVQWVMAIRGSGSEEVRAVTAVPGTTDFVVAGTFDGSLDVEGQPSFVSAGESDVFLARIDANGKIAWLRVIGGPGADRVGGVAADVAGNVFVAGAFNGPTLSDQGHTLANADKGGLATNDAFVAWFDLAGNHVYSTRFGDEGDDGAVAIGLDATGSVVLTGTFTRRIDFGLGALTARGRLDMFLAKLSR